MSATSVKYFHSGMAGAPSVNGTAGNMIGLLDAVLVNGWGLKTLDSLVVADGIATGTISTGHSFSVDSVALIAGVTGTTALNGEKRILSVSATQFTFDATGVADETSTGTITAKLAPLGWTKAFSGTNKAVYKPSDLGATGCHLRVDDASTSDARVVGYEVMSDVDTGTGPFPTTAQQSGGLFWPKGNTTSGARNWWVFGDERMFYVCLAPSTSYATRPFVFGFGDIKSYSATDAYNCVLAGAVASAANLAMTTTNCLSVTQLTATPAVAQTGLVAARDYTGVGSSQVLAKCGMHGGANSVGSGVNGYLATGIMSYPNGPDQSLILTPVLLYANGNVRGELPGFEHTPQTIAAGLFFTSGDAVAGTGAAAGKKRIAIRSGSQSTDYCVFFDPIGPWR